MALQKRKLLVGVALTALLVTSGALAANASDDSGFPEPTTKGGGSLSLATQEYSIDTIGVVADYSKFLYPDTVIDVKATDVATNKVVSTSHIDNNTWVHERVLSNFKLGHTYSLSATLSWKDGSVTPVTSPAVKQKVVFTDQIKTLTFKTLNQDVPVTALAGTVTRAEIRHDTRTDMRAYAQPSTVKVATVKASATSRTIKWNAARVNGGYSVTGYGVTVKDDTGRTVFTKRLSTSATRSIKVKGLKKNVFYTAEVKAYNLSGNYSTAYQFFTR